ncbi:MAG: 4-(cytidine 5'-diphospho)-2-C-methyl-D-erythritol kinase [Pseudomonadota bacterium]
MPLSILSPCKLNLFLHILGRRADGYHQLQTLFQLLDKGDQMTFEPTCDRQITLSTPITGINDKDNLIIRAANTLQSHTGIDTGANITIDKQLPIGGGIGGGSSNAATTLVALNYLWETKLNIDELCAIGLGLGADVPVFIQGRTAWAEGIGEQLQAIDLPAQWFLVIKPRCQVSTAEVFCHQELTRDSATITVAGFFEQGGRNDCESVVCRLYPEVYKALYWLKDHSSARLTGTGACVFAPFSSQEKAEQIRQQASLHWECFIAKGINHSPLTSLLP